MLLKQVKPGFKCKIFWNKYQSRVSTQEREICLDYLTDPSFQEGNRLLVLPFENISYIRGH